MQKPWLMGIDLGGSGARCLLVNRESNERHTASGSWRFTPAKGTFGTGFDIDLDTTWAVVGKACRDAVHQAQIGPDQVASVAVCAMRFSTVVIDAAGNSLLALPNRDARAVGEGFELAEQHGETLLAQTGSWPLPLHTSARLLWLQKQHPDQFAAVHAVLGMGEWLNYKLCGKLGIDASQASASGLFSLAERQWCWPMIDALGLSREIFPPVLAAGAVLGNLSAAGAQHIGLHPETPLAMGGADTQCSLLGGGVIAAGNCAVVAGTTAPVQRVMDRAFHDPSGQMLASHHVLPERWVLESNGGTMGESLSLMANILFPEAPEPELRLLAEAALAEHGSCGMLSTLGAEIMNMRAPTLPVGQMTMSHLTCAQDEAPRRNLVRALVEGCACALRANISCIDTAVADTLPAASNPECITLCGGMSRSDVFAQIVADVCQRDVQVAGTHQTSALGAAICAGVATGDYADFDSACQSLCTTRSSFTAQEEQAAANEQLFDAWTRYREQIQDSTGPVAMERMLPWVLKEPEDGAAATDAPDNLQALVSASFDADSLARLQDNMSVEYASFREVKRLLTGPDLVKALAGKHVFVTEVDVLDVAALGQLPDLRVVAACRGDAVNVDVEACTAFGIPVLFAPGRNAVAVADLTVAFMLALARKLPAAAQFLRQEDCTAGNMGKMGQAFNQLQGRELWHKTIGLIGLGAVGRAVAQRLAGFEARILVADPFVSAEQAALAGCELTDLDTLLASSDFVSIHAAVTPGTRGMLGAAEFARMHSGAFFINTARAALIDEQALVEALQADQIAGAALDTFAVEPPGFDHPLVQHPNVISTPHSAGNTVEVANHQGGSISAALLQLLAGETPACVLNPETLENFSWTGARPQPDAEELARLVNKSGPAITDLQRDAKAKDKQTTAPRRRHGGNH